MVTWLARWWITAPVSAVDLFHKPGSQTSSDHVPITDLRAVFVLGGLAYGLWLWNWWSGVLTRQELSDLRLQYAQERDASDGGDDARLIALAARISAMGGTIPGAPDLGRDDRWAYMSRPSDCWKD